MLTKYLLLKVILFLFFISFYRFSYSQDEFEIKMGDTTYTMKKYVFGMYKRGTNKEMDSVQIKKIQAAHLEHLTSLYKSGKLLVAGPLDGDNEIRGLMIFNVKDINEAESLVKEDPAVKSERLTYELYYWWAAKGSILK